MSLHRLRSAAVALALVAGLSSSPLLAQLGPQPQVAPRPSSPPPSRGLVLELLEFSGGSLQSFVDEIKTACEKQGTQPVNIVPAGTIHASDVEIPPIRLVSVHIQNALELLQLVSDSSKVRLRVTRLGDSGPTAGFSTDTFVLRTDPASTVTRSGTVPVARPRPSEPPRDFEIFSLYDLRYLCRTIVGPEKEQAEFDRTLETLLRSVTAAFEVLNPDLEKGPQPQIRFHPESSQLFVLGTRQELDIVTKILEHISMMKDQESAEVFRKKQKEEKDPFETSGLPAESAVPTKLESRLAARLGALEKQLQALQAQNQRLEAVIKSLSKIQNDDPTKLRAYRTLRSDPEKEKVRLKEKVQQIRTKLSGPERNEDGSLPADKPLIR